jgi:hypothetical protein
VIAHLRAGRALVDCRLANYVERGTIPGAINIPHPEIAARMFELDQLEPIVLSATDRNARRQRWRARRCWRRGGRPSGCCITAAGSTTG